MFDARIYVRCISDAHMSMIYTSLLRLCLPQKTCYPSVHSSNYTNSISTRVFENHQDSWDTIEPLARALLAANDCLQISFTDVDGLPFLCFEAIVYLEISKPRTCFNVGAGWIPAGNQVESLPSLMHNRLPPSFTLLGNLRYHVCLANTRLPIPKPYFHGG